MRLLEREAERAALDECVVSASGGEGRLVVISGEAGVGKTALTKELCARQRPTARVLWGQCDPLQTPRALGPVLDIARAAGGDLAKLADSDDRHRLFTEFLAACADGTAVTLAVLEDMQWADAATLDFLAFAGRRIEQTRCVLIATHRDDLRRDHPLRAALGDLATVSALRRFRLDPLSRSAVATLAAATSWDPVEVHRLSGGVPFVVAELLAAEPGDLTSVHDTVVARAAQLNPGARELLDTVALLPEGADTAMLAAALDEPEGAVDACVDAGLLVHDSKRVSFRHELARQVVDGTLTPTRRSRLHRRILAGMLEMGVADAAVCAHHAELAGDPGAVLRFAPLAARRAAAFGAHREAAEQYERALRFAGGLPASERACLLDAYVSELLVIDRPADALEASTDALSCWREAGDRQGLGGSLRRRMEVLRLAGQGESALAAGRQAIAVLEPEGDSLELARAYAVVAQGHMLRSEHDQCFEVARRGLEVAELFGDEETNVHLLTTYGTAQLCLGDPAGYPVLEESLRRAQAAGLDEPAGRAWNNLIDHYATSRQPDVLRPRGGGARLCVRARPEHAHSMHRGDGGSVAGRRRQLRRSRRDRDIGARLSGYELRPPARGHHRGRPCAEPAGRARSLGSARRGVGARVECGRAADGVPRAGGARRGGVALG